MKIPLEIQVQGMPPSEAVEKKVRARALGLERYSSRIQRCEVWLKVAHRHHRKGPFYAVRVRLTVPRKELVVEHQPGEEEVYVAIRQAFDAIRRQLEDYERRWPGQERGHRVRRRRPGKNGRRTTAPTRNSSPGSGGPQPEA